MLNNELRTNGSPLTKMASAIAFAAVDAAGRTGLAEKIREFARRVRRAGVLFVATISALIIFSLAIAPIPILLWLVAIPLAATASMLSMMWPSRPRKRLVSPKAHSLPQLARACLFLLRANRSHLFAGAREITARIEAQLKVIEHSSAGCRLDALADAELRRLIADHLPRLVESFSRLPGDQKNDPETREHLCASLRSVAGELESVRVLIDQRHSDRFDTERRFFASRYPELA